MTTHDLKEDFKAKAGQAARTVREGGLEALSELSDRASNAASALRAEAGDRADQARDALADEGLRLARTLRGAADDQPDGTLQRRVLGAVAGGVADVAEGLRGRSLGDLVAEAQGFARRNPGAFVAGAALLGFAAARFARASGPGRAPMVRPVSGDPAAPDAARANPQVPGKSAMAAPTDTHGVAL